MSREVNFAVRLSPAEQKLLSDMIGRGDFRRYRRLEPALKLALQIPPAADGSIDLTSRAMDTSEWDTSDLLDSLLPLIAAAAVLDPPSPRRFILWAASWIIYEQRRRLRKVFNL